MASILAELANYLNSLAIFADTLAGRIVAARRPKEMGDLGMTMSRASQEHHYHLLGETDLTGAVLRLDLWGRQSINAERLETIGEELRKQLSGFIGTWGSTDIESVRYLPTDNSNATNPRDASDYWQFRLTYLIQVNHKQTATRFLPTGV